MISTVWNFILHIFCTPWAAFSNLSVTSPTSQHILQPFCRFTYITAHSPTLLSLHLRHSSFSNPSFASPLSWAELILQSFRHFNYVTTHSPTLPSLYLPHSSFSNPSVALPTSQLILQPFRCFTYVTARSLTLLSLLLRHRLFTYVTWRAALGKILKISISFCPNTLSLSSEDCCELDWHMILRRYLMIAAELLVVESLVFKILPKSMK